MAFKACTIFGFLVVCFLAVAETAFAYCDNPLRVAIAIDSSRSILKDDFDFERNFVTSVVNKLKDPSIVTVTTYGTNVTINIKYNQFNKFKNLSHAITNLPYMDPISHGSNLTALFNTYYGKPRPQVFFMVKKETNTSYPPEYKVPDGRLGGVKKIVVTFGKESNIQDISDFHAVFRYSGARQGGYYDAMVTKVTETLCYALVSTSTGTQHTKTTSSTTVPESTTQPLVSTTTSNLPTKTTSSTTIPESTTFPESTSQPVTIQSTTSLIGYSPSKVASSKLGSTSSAIQPSSSDLTETFHATRLVSVSSTDGNPVVETSHGTMMLPRTVNFTGTQTPSPSNVSYTTCLSTPTPLSVMLTTGLAVTQELATKTGISSKAGLLPTAHSAVSSSSPKASVSIKEPVVPEQDNRIKELLLDLELLLNVSVKQVDSSNKTFVQFVLHKAASLLQTADFLDHILNASHLNMGSTGIKVLGALERFSLKIGEDITRKDNGNKYASYEAGGLVSRIFTFNISTFQGKVLGSLDKDNHSVFLPMDVFSHVAENGTRETGFLVNLVFDPFEALLKSQAFDRFEKNFTLVSKIVNVFTSPQAVGPLPSPVKITVEHSQPGFSDPQCVFWDYKQSNPFGGKWSKYGCHVFSSTQRFTECHCSHMTNYAVLMRPTEQVLSATDKHVLTVLTYIGCSFSIFGVFLTVITFLSLPVIKSEITKIHLNLSIAIGIAQVLFLAAGSKKLVHEEVICKLYAGLLFYFFMSVFTWMFVEGIHLYQLIVIAFVSRSMIKFYLALGWGLPACAVVIASSIARDGFGTSNFCWLSPGGGTIWAFVGPAIAVSSINLFILIRVIRVRMNISKQEGSKTQLRTSARVSLVLLPLLGITWLFGVLAVNEETVVFQYIFTISNSIQGLLIFIFHCAGNSEVRREFQRKASHLNMMKGLSSLSTVPTARVSPTPVEELHLETIEDRRLIKDGWVG